MGDCDDCTAQYKKDIILLVEEAAAEVLGTLVARGRIKVISMDEIEAWAKDVAFVFAAVAEEDGVL
jgi:hypothetical protein